MSEEIIPIEPITQVEGEIIGRFEKPKPTITELQIKQSIARCFRENTKWIPNDQLVLILFYMLKAVILEDKKYVFLKAPTGSGKSIIGLAYSWCWNVLHAEEFKDDSKGSQAYFLTSSKALQTQLQGDIDRFTLDDVKMLKGSANYECTLQSDQTGVYTSYKDRWCKNVEPKVFASLECKECCPYLEARHQASIAGVSVLNYWYFLSAIRKMKYIKDAEGNDTDELEEGQGTPMFGVRKLTICDESHLISDIVIGMYNLTLTIDSFMKKQAKVDTIKKHFSHLLKEENAIGKMDECIKQIYWFFTRSEITLDDVYEYELQILEISRLLAVAKIDIGEMFKDKEENVDENENNKGATNSSYLESLKERPDDLLIESSFHGKFGEVAIYKHVIYDMDEIMLMKRYFLSRIDVGIFMSATLPPFAEYAFMMGIPKDQYACFEMDNGFDFSKSPIYMQASGYLNSKSFKGNIQNVLFDTLLICEKNHKDQKGVIHTGTFEISKMLKEMIHSGMFPNIDKDRFYFYENSKEKEEILKMMKDNVRWNMILAGPSLYEGLDLKDDLGRFNILVKVPYANMSKYVQEKIKRFPFWYPRQTINKIEQSIGRTNRHKNDWSTTYLMDSMFGNIIFDCDNHIIKRLKQGAKI